MAGFSVTSNHYLRQAYGKDRSLVNSNARLKIDGKDLAKADTSALKRSIATLSNYDFDAEKDDPKKLFNHLKAFADTYNYSLESSNDLPKEARTKGIVKEMKALRNKYGEQLEKYGIKFTDRGYMTVSESSTTNVSAKSFKNMVGADSEFIKDLSNIQKKLSRRIDYLA